MSIKTKGTELFFIYPYSGGYSVVKFGCPKGIQGLGGAKSQIDETCLDSLEMEFGPGMGSPGAITVNTDIDFSKVSHQDIIIMDRDDDKVTWIVGFSDGTAAPTVNGTTGVVTYPSTRSYVSFLGYIADLPLDFSINSNVTSAVSIQRSGAKTYHFKA